MDFWIIPLVLVFGVVIMALPMLSAKPALRKLKTTFNGAISWWIFYLIFKGRYQGLNFTVRLDPPSRSSPPYLRICLFKECKATLKVCRENTMSEMGKKLGLIQEVKVNDPEFDSKVLIFSNDPGRLSGYLSSVEMKNTIVEIFNSGFSAITTKRKGIEIKKPDYDAHIDLTPESITFALQKLSALARGL